MEDKKKEETLKKTEEGNPDLKEARAKFEKKYTEGVCQALFRAGSIKDVSACVAKSKKTAEEISRTWEKHWSEKMKKFLGVS